MTSNWCNCDSNTQILWPARSSVCDLWCKFCTLSNTYSWISATFQLLWLLCYKIFIAVVYSISNNDVIQQQIIGPATAVAAVPAPSPLNRYVKLKSALSWGLGPSDPPLLGLLVPPVTYCLNPKPLKLKTKLNLYKNLSFVKKKGKKKKQQWGSKLVPPPSACAVHYRCTTKNLLTSVNPNPPL